MTDNKIIKGLERIASWVCDECKFHGEMCDGNKCEKVIADNTLDLINRQKAEIERLKKKANTPFAKITFDRDELQEIVDKRVKNIEIDINLVKSEAIKEFAERLKDEMRLEDDCQYDCMNCLYECKGYVLIIDNLVKEMTEVETNQRKEDEGK